MSLIDCQISNLGATNECALLTQHLSRRRSSTGTWGVVRPEIPSETPSVAAARRPAPSSRSRTRLYSASSLPLPSSRYPKTNQMSAQLLFPWQCANRWFSSSAKLFYLFWISFYVLMRWLVADLLANLIFPGPGCFHGDARTSIWDESGFGARKRGNLSSYVKHSLTRYNSRVTAPVTPNNSHDSDTTCLHATSEWQWICWNWIDKLASRTKDLEQYGTKL